MFHTKSTLISKWHSWNEKSSCDAILYLGMGFVSYLTSQRLPLLEISVFILRPPINYSTVRLLLQKLWKNLLTAIRIVCTCSEYPIIERRW